MYRVRRQQNVQKINAAADGYFLESVSEYVQFYSLVQVGVIMLSAIIQTYFIKKLFQNEQSSASSKGFKPKA